VSHLALSVLGPLQISLDGQPVSGFESSKVRALLAYLAVDPDSAHSRDALIGLLWPERPERAARSNLSQALANLRQVLGDRKIQAPFLLINAAAIQFNCQSDYWLDLRHFDALLAACDRHPHRGKERCHACLHRLAEAASLYRGSFLDHFPLGSSVAFEEWVLMKRERLQQLALSALGRLAEGRLRQGEPEQAYAYAVRQLELDPWREEAHRQAMRALALRGERTMALEQYARCRQVLRVELGVEPAQETTALVERIRAGLSASTVTPVSIRNLPLLPTVLVGRATDIAELSARVENPACRLITLVGPGGVGKTRLALAVAATQADTFEQGAAFVALDSLSSADWLAATILQALGITLLAQADPKAQLLAVLSHQ